MEEVLAWGFLADWSNMAENLYNNKLDRLFLENSDNPDLLEMESISGNINETINYISNHINFSKINTEIFIKSLVCCLKTLYNSMDIEIFAKLSYRLWTRLPADISEKSQLLILNYADDYVSIGFIESAKQKYEELFSYYE